MTVKFALSATAKFLIERIGRRKAVIMLRTNLKMDSPSCNSPFVKTVRRQFSLETSRRTNTNTVDLPIEGPGA